MELIHVLEGTAHVDQPVRTSCRAGANRGTERADIRPASRSCWTFRCEALGQPVHDITPNLAEELRRNESSPGFAIILDRPRYSPASHTRFFRDKQNRYLARLILIGAQMSRIFITGSSEGLGLMAGQWLVEQGHQVVLHARNGNRAEDARTALPNVAAVVEGDVSTLTGMRMVAEQANRLGQFDAIIHNVGVGYREARRIETEDGLPHVLAINVIAPYILTALIKRPRRLIYLSSGMHHNVSANFDDLLWTKRRWEGSTAYAESKLYDAMLAFAVARSWPDVLSNSLEPGWVPTKMGGAGAPDDMGQAHRTQAWLAVSDDRAAQVTSTYFYHLQTRTPNPETHDEAVQNELLARCQDLSGIPLPTGNEH
jgi:NAD(P)-dependent dehydrogenase (short-subunit alcohol dehydrogenase family)